MQSFSNCYYSDSYGKNTRLLPRHSKPIKIQVSNIYSDSKMTCKVKYTHIFDRAEKKKQVRLIKKMLKENIKKLTLLSCSL